MGSMLVFEIIFGLKIGVFIIKDNYEFINNINDLFAVKMPKDPNLKRELEKPFNTTISINEGEEMKLIVSDLSKTYPNGVPAHIATLKGSLHPRLRRFRS
ncbi:hypothetical protein JYT44_01030 [Caldithrix abyssi]|nr:hypothetical protein [Caldithrix abyssi]